MFDAVDRAAACVFLEMYLFAPDGTGEEFRDHLAAAALRGVEVMVLVDAWGSLTTPDAFWQPLRIAGGRVRLFRSMRRGLFPFRDHRKLLLVDDRQAFLGGMNVADEYRSGKRGAPAWRDNLLEISGPEAARLRRPFLRMWSRAERPLRLRALLRKSPPAVEQGRSVHFWTTGPGGHSRLPLQAHRDLIRGAVGHIDLAMSYFFPPGRILRELRRAVRRGLRVRVLLPRTTDVPMMRWAARGLYGRLLRRGIEVWEYLPAMLHAKIAITGDTLVVGSANLDLRSDRMNHELVAVVRDPALAAQANREFEADLGRSSRVDLGEWRRRPWGEKIRERVSYWLVARADIVLSRLELFRTRW